jgi:hypothetical protein
MTALAAHLVDNVFPQVPIRQWVLTVPHRVRYLLAWDHTLCRAVLAVFIRAILAFYRRRARRRGMPGGRGGTVTAIQRFGSAVNLNVHYHTLALDGVFAEAADGHLRFHPAAPPSDAEVAQLLATIRTRVLRLLARHGFDLDGTNPSAASSDPLADESPALAGLSSAAVQGRIALGPHAGARILQIGRDPDAPWVTSRAPRHAHLEGFDLHANVAVAADHRAALERLCRYILRPPLAQERLQRTPDGRVMVGLKTPWADGTTHLLFDPLELLAKLAVLTPRPRVNTLIYHGVLAAHARGRPAAVTYAGTNDALPAPPATGAEVPAPLAAAPVAAPADSAPNPTPPRPFPRNPTWALLMRRAFDFDVLACPRCGAQMTLLATIDDPRTVRRILSHLGISTEIPYPAPCRAPPAADDLFAELPT